VLFQEKQTIFAEGHPGGAVFICRRERQKNVTRPMQSSLPTILFWGDRRDRHGVFPSLNLRAEDVGRPVRRAAPARHRCANDQRAPARSY
jgi:hypothetical protein